MKDFYELPLIIKRKSIFEKREGDPTNRKNMHGSRDTSFTSHANSVIKKMGMDSFKMRGSTKKEKALNFLKNAIKAQFDDGEQYFRYFFDDVIDAGEGTVYIPIVRYKTAGEKYVDADRAARDKETGIKMCLGFIKALLTIASACDEKKAEWDNSTDRIKISYSKERRPVIVIKFNE